MAKQSTLKRLVNQEIKAPEIRVVGADGEQLGVMKTTAALNLARSEKLDLVEIAPNAEPPVCKIADFGKMVYEDKKRAKELAKKNREARVELKELWLRPVTDQHDLEVKVRHAREFLDEGNKVRFTVKFRGREVSRSVQGQSLLEKIIDMVGPVKVDAPISQSGKQMTVTLSKSQ